MNQTLAGILISFLLVAASLYLHFKALRRGASRIAHLKVNARQTMMMIMAVIFLAHLLEIILFAIVYWLMTVTGLGELSGNHTSTAADFFYFSIATYTTLGIGDIMPEGAIRLVAGVESLAGLLLIAWSASFTYLAMERLWTDDLQG
ncbi:MAG: hypothetical protein A3J40_12175 [Erythrobacter sp. RIFCSPHIGHO2_12_FULL_63_10]|nr:MAG: hypothetical protein A3J40_12175 [Erythrobacter sp. RIFCSPHIGHO2_12_FULL_63_10]